MKLKKKQIDEETQLSELIQLKRYCITSMNLIYTIKGDVYIYKMNKNCFYFIFYKGRKTIFN